MSPRCSRRPGGRAKNGAPAPDAVVRPGCGGNASGGTSGNDSTSVGPSTPMCVAFNRASSASSARISPIDAGAGAPAASSAAATTLPRVAPSSRRPDAVADVEVDPPRRSIDGPGHEAGVSPPPALHDAARDVSPAGAASRGDPPRLQLHDGVLRVRDPGVVHAQELLHERVPDALEVAQRQVALVELTVADALIDDPRDHRPDRRLVARCQGANGRLDAVGQHDQGGLTGLRLGPRMTEPALVDDLARPSPPGRSASPPYGSAARSLARAKK